MSGDLAAAAVNQEVSRLVVLTVYARSDITVCSRIMKILAVQRVAIERFVADFSRVNLQGEKGLVEVQEPTMRFALAVSVPEERDLEHLTKLLNRIVDVYKVVPSYPL